MNTMFRSYWSSVSTPCNVSISNGPKLMLTKWMLWKMLKCDLGSCLLVPIITDHCQTVRSTLIWPPYLVRTSNLLFFETIQCLGLCAGSLPHTNARLYWLQAFSTNNWSTEEFASPTQEFQEEDGDVAQWCRFIFARQTRTVRMTFYTRVVLVSHSLQKIWPKACCPNGLSSARE